MHDSACGPCPSRVRGTVILRLALLLSLLSLSGAHASEIAFDEGRAKPRPPAGFPVVPGVYRLDGTDPSLGTADLEPLRQIIGGAPIVSLGESVHTVGGYYEMKHRIFRFLVEKMGFRAFAMETYWEPAERLSQYVQTCEGAPEEALEGLFPVWKSAEVAALAQWTCEWNRSHPRARDKVHLFGFDTQQPRLDGRGLLAFLERIGIGPEHPWSAAVRDCDGVERSNPWPVSDSVYEPCMEALDAIRRHFDRNARTIIRQTSAEDLAWARIRITSLEGWQGEAHFRLSDKRSWESRDSAMASVFRSIRDLRYRNLRTVIWAHNAHIWENPHPWFYWSRMMGTHLREIYGRGYVSIGLIGWNVEIDWPGEGCGGPYDVEPPDSAEAHLESLGHDFLLADLASPARPPFFEPGRSFVLSYAHVEPRLYFDALIWLRHARKMDPLAWPSCR